MTARALAKGSIRGWDADAWGRALAYGLIAVGLAARLRDYASAPLWLDESWTGAIVAAPDLPSLWRQVLSDVNAPLYPLLAFGWSKLAGLSNEALRAPALAFGLAAPLLCLWPGSTLPLRLRLAWAALVALFPMAVAYAQEARSYGMLFFMATALAIAHLRLLAAPTRLRAAVWAGVGALTTLTHYHAGLLVAAQGLALLALHGRATLRLWPAAFLFLAPAAWLALHAPTILRFMDPALAWYPLLRPSVTSLFILVSLMIVALVTMRAARAPDWRPLAATVLPSCLVGLLVLVYGFVRPSFTWRYMMAFYPGVLLGCAFIGMEAIRSRRLLMALGAPVLALLSLAAWSAHPVRKPLNYEAASAWLMEKRAQRLVFLWDNPTARAVADDQLALLGGFFFLRAGTPMSVTPLKLAPGEDAHPILARQGEADSLLWLYDFVAPGTSAIRHPPRIEALEPQWTCRNFGERSIGVLACVK